MLIRGVGFVRKDKAMKILTNEEQKEVKEGAITTKGLGRMYKLELVKRASKVGKYASVFQASYKWIPDDLKEKLTPKQLGKLTDNFYGSFQAGKTYGHEDEIYLWHGPERY